MKKPTLYKKGYSKTILFRIPNMEGKEPKGFKLVRNWFVSKHSWSDSGPAMDPHEFVKKAPTGYYYAIRNEGHFQVNIGQYKKVKK